MTLKKRNVPGSVDVVPCSVAKEELHRYLTEVHNEASTEVGDRSILQNLLARDGLTADDVLTLVMDLLIAGVDTVSGQALIIIIISFYFVKIDIEMLFTIIGP